MVRTPPHKRNLGVVFQSYAFDPADTLLVPAPTVPVP
jgi:ABC-type Fe3+/spermidine/putrescine transport system ATPase subunit